MQPFGSTSTFDSTPAPASNLHTERLGDGSANCLEKAVGLARPGDSIVLMRDASDGVGHALVRRPDGSVAWVKASLVADAEAPPPPPPDAATSP
ncbi:hypothetical protein HI113_38430 [Corallococcus exiguus]|uniref:hypothetical protein n=1 Tax=Corallococcus TaxID=83461 RepID=UPI000ED26974|nr:MULTISPECIES: hypothetical protein [Corallococcus]NNB87327.1 hypothetical protein [Corallococcus exiguus]NNB99774.1 hypothetical protein [Corallococcus exiguus]NPC47506.1 hypothetical protein [Corallococcus exiguus]RKH82691.1 hypothetical protein D7X99_14865 [Corallococcus sp. AB032C]